MCYRGHDDEVLDVAFDYTGERIVTASSDGTLPVLFLQKCQSFIHYRQIMAFMRKIFK